MRVLLLVVGVAVSLLGGLWLVQGLGLVTIRPILCVADCEPLEGASPTWAIIGGLALALGGLAIAYALRRRAAP